MITFSKSLNGQVFSDNIVIWNTYKNTDTLNWIDFVLGRNDIIDGNNIIVSHQ